MGMFDSLMVKCPNCNEQVEFQSKAGGCNLYEYSITDVPAEIAIDLQNEFSVCESCGYHCKLNVQVIKMVNVI